MAQPQATASFGQMMTSDLSNFYANKAAFKPAIIAAGAGLGSYFLLRLPAPDALQYGAVVAFGASVMDGVLIAMGKDVSIDKAMGDTVSKYIDPSDFVGGALGGLGLFYMAGMRDRPLAYAAVLGGLASGIAPKVADYLVAQMMAARLKKLLQPAHSNDPAQGQ